MRDTRGFTLIELLLYIFIISIVLSVPMLKMDVLYKHREKQELRELVKDINYARNKTITESFPYTVILDSSRNSYTVYRQSHPVKKPVKKREFNSGLKLRQTTLHNHEVKFSLSGVPTNSGTILLEDKDGKAIKISISPVTGRVNVYYNN